ncbi:hypothetical protein J6590_070446 [Homalodisca vitripennis]|nr:hypothetical protein J6590_070446 [Homalodisca vitripennis]
MFPVLLAAFVLSSGATGLSSSENASAGRSYSSDNSFGNSYVVSSHHLVSDTQPSYSSPASRTGYTSRSYGGYSQYQGLSNNYPQKRFHPTTYEEDSHKGEIILPPLNSDSIPAASQDSVSSASDLQGSFLQPNNNIGSEPVVQSSDSFAVQVDPSFASSGKEVQYDYPQPTPPPLPSGYDYQPPPPPAPPPPPPPTPAPYYYYPPPSPPTNLYLPVPKDPPPPPPPEVREAEYTYFFIGPKLWYIPIICSIYFALYVGALIIMSVSRHKVRFPQQLYTAANSVFTGRQDDLDQLTARVTRGLAVAALKYLRHRANTFTQKQ